MDPKRTPPPRPGAGPVKAAKPPAAPAPGGRPGGPAPPAARRGPAVSEALDGLARDIRQLQIDFERFFNGGIALPPEDLRARVQAQLRTLRNTSVTSAVDSFRMSDLEARFNTYNELFNRRLREREEGRNQAHRAVPAAEKKRFDPAEGIVFGREVDPEAVEALYTGLASRPGDGPRFDLDSFQTYLSRQADAIRQKTGCSEVQFRLAEEDGKLKLKARPLTGRAGS